MRIVIELPASLEKAFGESGDAGRALKEAALVDWYRQRKITHNELGDALGLSWYETEGLLKRHKVYHEITLEQVEAEARAMREEIKR